MGYYSEFFVFNHNCPVPALLRNYTEKDFDELIVIQSECFPAPFPEELWWNREQLQNHVTLFPDGAICIELAGQLAGSITSLLVDFHPDHPVHTWSAITDDGYIRTHNPNGNTLYIVDICIRPSFRKYGFGKWMMHALYQLAVEKKLDRVLGGGRIPGYKKFADVMSAEQYVEQVVEGKLNDPVVSFLLKCGRSPVAIVKNYLEDEDSLNHGVLMEWRNPFRHRKESGN